MLSGWPGWMKGGGGPRHSHASWELRLFVQHLLQEDLLPDTQGWLGPKLVPAGQPW